jgi:cellulose synthase/poly-beta-1,6-N-acetylglucosamine synthase-like glycosyltransferase
MKLPKHKDAPHHKFAIIVSARNEENVINNLFDSIDAQDYPRELITVALVADNCTDRTAEVAEERGNVKVYRRYSETEKGKGYALNFLLEKLDEDFGPDAFDAYIVFDADNILTRNYITEINKTFSDGYEVVTSYRNSKNYGDSWLAAGSGLWFIRESKYLNGSRMRIGACPQCSGTGFLFSNEIKKENGGWPFHTLTEDYEFTCHSVVRGKKFGYCENAMFYDEQVSGFRQSWRQRIRWTKGGLQGFIKYWKQLVAGLFSKKFIACYDMLMSIAPAYILSLVACLVNLVGAVLLIATGSDFWETVLPMMKMVIGAYTILLIQSIVATATEWRKIHTNPFKKILYAFTFPFFILTFIPICFIAIFKKVEWKPIRHTSLGSDDVEKVIAENDTKIKEEKDSE